MTPINAALNKNRKAFRFENRVSATDLAASEKLALVTCENVRFNLAAFESASFEYLSECRNSVNRRFPSIAGK